MSAMFYVALETKVIHHFGRIEWQMNSPAADLDIVPAIVARPFQRFRRFASATLPVAGYGLSKLKVSSTGRQRFS